MYDISAEWYAEMMDSEIDLPIYTDTLARLHTSIENISGILVDTACGSGHMLALYHEQFDHGRPLLGIDLSPHMVALARKNLGESAQIETGDMRELSAIDSGSAAAVINFFALHHIDSEAVRLALHEWNRILQPGGQLLIATWEGDGTIDYGDESAIVALRYRSDELASLVQEAGFMVARCVVESVEGFPMDAIYLNGVKKH